jgi:hypothetical protein
MTWKKEREAANAEARAAILYLLAERPGLHRDDIAAALGATTARTSALLNAMSKTGGARCYGLGEHARWYLPGAAQPTTVRVGPGVGPSLEVGDGEKHCALYEGCLARFVERFPRHTNAPARCPRACAEFVPFKRAIDLAAATRQRRSPMEAA